MLEIFKNVKVTSALFLVGGLGTRIKSTIPEGLPKALAPIGSRPFIEYLFKYWAEKGIERFILASGVNTQKIQAYFGHSFEGVLVEYVSDEALAGTGGALLEAKSRLDKLTLISNGDTFVDIDLTALIDFHVRRNSEWTVVLSRAPWPNRYSPVQIDGEGRVISFFGMPSGNSSLANSGVSIIDKSIFEIEYSFDRCCSLERDILPRLIDGNRQIFGITLGEHFIDIGTPADYSTAQITIPKILQYDF